MNEKRVILVIEDEHAISNFICRALMANDYKPIPAASGSEVYVYSETSPAFPLGEAILVGLQNATGLRNRGMFIRPSLYVLRRTNMPALLVEMGYLTNPEDARLLSTDPQSFARGIYNGMLSYFQLT